MGDTYTKPTHLLSSAIYDWSHELCVPTDLYGAVVAETMTYTNIMQSCVEIEGYSVTYFDRIAVFNALYCWTSIRGGAHMHFEDVWISHKSTKPHS